MSDDKSVSSNPESGSAQVTLILAVVPVIAGLLGTIFGAVLQGYFNVQLEREKFEFSLMQKALEAKNREEIAKQLLFLVDSGVIRTLDSEKIQQVAKNPEQLPESFGRASTGEEVVLSKQSIKKLGTNSYSFQYQIGGELVDARADCKNNRWYASNYGWFSPQSQSTRNMLSYVCNHGKNDGK